MPHPALEGHTPMAPETQPPAAVEMIEAASQEAAAISNAENTARPGWRLAVEAFGMAAVTGAVALGGGYTCDSVTRPHHSNCNVNVDDATMRRTQALLDSPDPPAIDKLQRSLSHYGSAGPLNYFGAESTLFNFRKQVADSQGLAVTNDLEYDSQLVSDVEHAMATNTPTTIPFQEYVTAAEKFLALYGITIYPLSGGERTSADIEQEAPTPPDLESTVAKEDIIDLMQEVSGLPVEYVSKLTGVKRVVLTDIAPATQAGQTVIRKALHYGNTISINVQATLEKGDVRHELGHGVVNTVEGPDCLGGDPAFSSLNRGVPYSGKVNGDVGVTMEGFIREDDELISSVSFSRNKSEKAAATASVRQYESSVHPTFVNNYSGSALREDQANSLRVLTQSTDDNVSYYNILRLDCPARDKFVLMAARIFTSSKIGPRLLTYFADTNRRHPNA